MENEDILNSGIEPNNDLKDLMKELTALKNENDALKTDVNRLETWPEKETLEHRNTQLKAKLAAMESRLGERNDLDPPSAVYVPALCEGLRYQFKKGNKIDADYVPAFADSQRFKKGYGFSWWTEDSPFYYPRILVSAYYGMKDSHFYRDELQIGKEVLFMGDSGGFQIASVRKKGGNLKGLTPMNVLEWLKTNCDIGLALDIPPTLSGAQPTDQEYQWAKKTLVEHNNIYERHRDDLMVYNVLHGETDERMNDWYETVKDTSFEGWAVGLKPSSHPILQARGLGFMAQKGHTENIHVLGASGFDVIPLFAHASKTIDNLTYDSSSYNRGVIERQYVTPMNMRFKMHFGTKDDNQNARVRNTRLNSMPCNCPVCVSTPPEKMFEEGSWAGSILSMHNLYWYLYYADTMKIMANANNQDTFRNYVSASCKDTAVLSMDIYDALLANDDAEYDRLMLQASLGAQNKAKETSKKDKKLKKKDEEEAQMVALDITTPGWDELF